MSTRLIPIKTYFRELTWMLTLFWMGMTIWGVFDEAADRAATAMMLPVFGLVTAAHAAKRFGKQDAE
jgi:hypothetical protein